MLSHKLLLQGLYDGVVWILMVSLSLIHEMYYHSLKIFVGVPKFTTQFFVNVFVDMFLLILKLHYKILWIHRWCVFTDLVLVQTGTVWFKSSAFANATVGLGTCLLKLMLFSHLLTTFLTKPNISLFDNWLALACIRFLWFASLSYHMEGDFLKAEFPQEVKRLKSWTQCEYNNIHLLIEFTVGKFIFVSKNCSFIIFLPITELHHSNGLWLNSSGIFF